MTIWNLQGNFPGLMTSADFHWRKYNRLIKLLYMEMNGIRFVRHVNMILVSYP